MFFFGIFTRTGFFLKAPIALFMKFTWAAESHFAFTFESCFSAVGCFGSENVRACKFVGNKAALIAQFGSENQAQPTRVLASVLRFNSV
jgi:hypothetical protein